MNRALYPPDWNDISRQVREEAGQRCEWCGVNNHAVGARSLNGIWYGQWDIEATGDREKRLLFGTTSPKLIRIVLTVAHVHDPDPMNVERGNLAALCQRCHNRADAPMRSRNAAVTRARKRAEAIAATGQQGLL